MPTPHWHSAISEIKEPFSLNKNTGTLLKTLPKATGNDFGNGAGWMTADIFLAGRFYTSSPSGNLYYCQKYSDGTSGVVTNSQLSLSTDNALVPVLRLIKNRVVAFKPSSYTPELQDFELMRWVRKFYVYSTAHDFLRAKEFPYGPVDLRYHAKKDEVWWLEYRWQGDNGTPGYTTDDMYTVSMAQMSANGFLETANMTPGKLSPLTKSNSLEGNNIYLFDINHSMWK